MISKAHHRDKSWISCTLRHAGNAQDTSDINFPYSQHVNFLAHFLASRSLQPELSLSCMTGTPCTLYLSWPPGHFSLNCPCPARMYTVPFLTSRSLQPELSLSCMTGTPCTLSRSLQPELSLSCMTDTPCPLYLYVCILACLCRVQAYINFVWSSQACICIWWYNWLPTNFTWSNVSVVVTHN